MQNQKDQLLIDTIRFLSIDGVEKAKAGHPGLPMGVANIAWVIWKNHLRLNPQEPQWFGRDRFILSAGHGSMLLYSLLHLFGYDISLEDLRQFRQWGSKTPGHPEYNIKLGIETTTGPLGQGFATGVGMAISAKYFNAKFNQTGLPIFDQNIYSICGDGDLMEGVSSEAASLAGHLKLGNLIYIYDDNGITIDGSTDLSFSENVGERFEAYHWHVQKIDGYDSDAINNALEKAKETGDKPSLIIAKTHIGFGSPNKQDTASAHGSPLGKEETILTKEHAGWPLEPDFYIPDEVYPCMKEIIARKIKTYNKWQGLHEQYERENPEKVVQIKKMLNREIPSNIDSILPVFGKEDKLASRAASGKVINAVAEYIPSLIGGSADLAPSNNTLIKGEENFSAENYGGRNFHFGVREHGMGSIANGMALFGGVIPYIGTFMVFSDYMRPAIRMAAMMKQQLIYVFTHDSIGLGEDGPTHQPVEQLAALRAIPGLTVIRPADGNETAVAWKFALNNNGPTALILSRQGLQTVVDFKQATQLERGAYVIHDPGKEPAVTILASGSEVALAVESAKDIFTEQKISVKVISFPSWEIFSQQDDSYKNKIVPEIDNSRRMGIEAAISMGWTQWGIDLKHSIFMPTYGESAPGNTLFEKFGFNKNNVKNKIIKMVNG